VGTDELIDQIYEAGIVPEKWRSVLDQLARIGDAEGTLLFAAGANDPRWLSSDAIQERMQRWTESKWYLNNPRGERLVPLTEPRFLTDLDGFGEQEWVQTEFFKEFLQPLGLGWCVGTTVRSPTGDVLVFSIEKAFAKGPVPRAVAERLDLFRPHLARAALLSARLGLERVRSAVAALELIGLPAAALSSDSRVLATNGHLLNMSPRIEIGFRDRLTITSESAQKLLLEGLSAAAGPAPRLGRSIPVPGSNEQPPFVAHLLPLRGGALDVFAGAVSILYVTQLTPKSSPAPELLQALFDLTPAEARVASLLVAGRTIDAIAGTAGSSENTVRTHLKSVFMKTGVQRQAELVSLLGIPPILFP